MSRAEFARERSRLDVLVHVEQIGRVVFPLDRDQPIVVPLVVVPDSILIVAGHKVDIPPANELG